MLSQADKRVDVPMNKFAFFDLAGLVFYTSIVLEYELKD